jgi:hypothetical protein
LLEFDLRLDERHADRVVVWARLAACSGPARVDGVALELSSREGESLSPRVLLPIAGDLGAEIVVRVELRGRDVLPPGARVHGTAWWADGEQSASCPADPQFDLEAHVRGARCIPPAAAIEIASLGHEERCCLARRFPWIEAARPCRPPAANEPLDVTDESANPRAQGTDVDALGLDPESAEILREILDE